MEDKKKSIKNKKIKKIKPITEKDLINRIRWLEKHTRFLTNVISGLHEKNENILTRSLVDHIKIHIDNKIREYHSVIDKEIKHYELMNINEFRTFMLETYRIVERLENKINSLEGKSHGSGSPSSGSNRSHKD